MTATLALVFVVVVGFVIGHAVTTWGGNRWWTSGVQYVLLGALLGAASPIALVDERILAQLTLLVEVILGLFGFLIGLRIREATQDFEESSSAVFSAIFSAALLFIPMLALATALLPGIDLDAPPLLARPVYADESRIFLFWMEPMACWFAVTLAAAAVTSSRAAVRAIAEELGSTGALVKRADTSAALGNVVAIGLAAVALAGMRSGPSGSGDLSLLEWVIIASAVGVGVGLLFALYIGREEDPERLLLTTVGAVVFASGLAQALGISPMFVNLVAGLVVSFTSPHAPRLAESLARLRPPLMVITMLLAGLYWQPPAMWVWLLVPLYLGLRWVAVMVSHRAADAAFVPPTAGKGRAPSTGPVVMVQGSIAAAIAVAYAVHQPALGPEMTSVVLAAMLIGDPIGRRVARRAVANDGDFAPLAPAKGLGKSPVEPRSPGATEAAADAAPEAAPEGHAAPTEGASGSALAPPADGPSSGEVDVGSAGPEAAPLAEVEPEGSSTPVQGGEPA